MITYEYPLNERIRTLLRLENLFEKTLYYAKQSGAHEHHATLMALFEILDVASRADLKVDLVQELERQKQALRSFSNNPDISEEALAEVLAELEQAANALRAMAGKIGQYLRESEWLMAIRSRASIPGGVCEFDLPSYHFWLNLESESRQADLQAWVAPMLPIRDGLKIVLRLLRASGNVERQIAKNGSYRLMFGGRSVQLIRLGLERREHCVPEISANKYLANIRFVLPETVARPRQVHADVPFELVFCNL